MTQAEAIKVAERRFVETGKPQIVYQSQPGHFLWRSLAAYQTQHKLTPNFVKGVGV